MKLKDEISDIKFLLLGCGIFLYAGYQSLNEVRFSLSGIETDGRVVAVYDTQEPRKSNWFSKDYWNVEYEFKDANKKRWLGVFRVQQSEASSYKDKEMRVVYLASDPALYASPVEQRSILWPAVFIGLALYLGWSFFGMRRPRRIS